MRTRTYGGLRLEGSFDDARESLAMLEGIEHPESIERRAKVDRARSAAREP